MNLYIADIDYCNYLHYNEEQEILGKPLFANARNAAAGSLRQLNSKITEERPLDIYIFNVQKWDDNPYNSHYEQLKYLEKLGFNVNPVKIPCKTYEDVINAINKIGEDRENLSFGIDGAVIKVDSLSFREKLDGVKNFQVAVKEKGEDVIFLRKILPGGTDESYGVHVAKLAGVPQVVTKRANEILKSLERKNILNGKTVENKK